MFCRWFVAGTQTTVFDVRSASLHSFWLLSPKSIKVALNPKNETQTLHNRIKNLICYSREAKNV